MGQQDRPNDQTTYDVAVIGGGAAGLSGAIILGRSRRSVIVIDAGAPRNSPAEGVHGFLGHDGLSPLELLARGRAEAERYGAEIRRSAATSARRTEHGFAVDLADGAVVNARRLLVTTGLEDQIPDLPGL